MPKSNTLPKSVNMSTQCPFCGRIFDYTMYPEIHIPGDNKLKKKILNSLSLSRLRVRRKAGILLSRIRPESLIILLKERRKHLQLLQKHQSLL